MNRLIEKLRALHRAATDGVWSLCPTSLCVVTTGPTLTEELRKGGLCPDGSGSWLIMDLDNERIGWKGNPADAAFVAAIHEKLPELLDEVEKVQIYDERMRQTLGQVCSEREEGYHEIDRLKALLLRLGKHDAKCSFEVLTTGYSKGHLTAPPEAMACDCGFAEATAARLEANRN